jgi:D-3-phosphoglycerate dehydrogenase
VLYHPDLKDDSLTEAIRASGADVLVVRSTKVTAAMMDVGRLSLIVRAGAGYNTIDVAGASARGIYVSNCPGKNAVAVAELAFALILALDRRVPDNVADLRAGKWNKKEYSRAEGLYGKTLGLLGGGSIGQAMIHRAAGFGLDVLIWSRRYTGQQGPLSDREIRDLGLESAARQVKIELAPSPGDVAEQADILSVHLALGPETRGIVGAELLARMKPGAMFINTSRGEVVDHAALAEAVSGRKLRVGLDVFANEPSAATGDFSDELLALPNVYGTHHIGASTDQAQEAIAAETVRIIRTYQETGRVPNVVNLARRTPATHMLVVRHRDRPGVLAHVFDQLRRAELNVQETENIVFEGAEAAVARVNLDGAPPDDACELIRKNPDVLDLQVVTL